MHTEKNSFDYKMLKAEFKKNPKSIIFLVLISVIAVCFKITQIASPHPRIYERDSIENLFEVAIANRESSFYDNIKGHTQVPSVYISKAGDIPTRVNIEFLANTYMLYRGADSTAWYVSQLFNEIKQLNTPPTWAESKISLVLWDNELVDSHGNNIADKVFVATLSLDEIKKTNWTEMENARSFIRLLRTYGELSVLPALRKSNPEFFNRD